MVARVNLIPAKVKPEKCSAEAWAAIAKQKRVDRLPMIDAEHAIKASHGAWQIEQANLQKAQVNLDLETMDDRGLKVTALSVGINLGGANKKPVSRKRLIQMIEERLAAVEFAPDDED